MRKYADKYLDVDPWAIVETGFHPKNGRVTESLFAQANEHMGARAYFEEGYSGDSLVGSYLNGIFEGRVLEKSYKGISDRLCFMVNTVDWTYVRLSVAGERLDLAESEYRDFQRRLDFQTGLLSRSFVWILKSGAQIEVSFERLLGMDCPECAYQRVSLRALKSDLSVEVEAGLDFSIRHEAYDNENHWNVAPAEALPRGGRLVATSRGQGQKVDVAFRLSGAGAEESSLEIRDKFVSRRFVVALRRDEKVSFDKAVSVVADRLDGSAVPNVALDDTMSFDAALVANRTYWKSVWDVADIQIDGDVENQQGIRFCIFQLEQTFRGRVPGANIGAKGLTGEAYNGNAFWDTEAYCFPYYLFKNADTARALLDYRYRTLTQAKARARALDCEGACFPVATIDGTESCNLWQHASLQFQPTTAVAYALGHYVKVTGDRDYLYEKGAELMVEIARFLASRVGYSERKQAYGFYAVMGPDEFQMMVNHNAYTNFMGAKSLAYAVEVWKAFEQDKPGDADRLASKLGLSREELDRWQSISLGMYIPKDGVFEQHEGFFDLPHVDIKSIPPEEFPLYHSWSYDRIYRNDMIKQPDVLMFMFLYNQQFSLEEKRANYDYYEPRTIHESSLSPSVHSIFAVELGKKQEAYDFFKFATRIDLDNYNRNTREGLHLTAIAAAWMNIVYGFGGLRSDGDHLVLNPSLPDAWNNLSFKLNYQGSLFKVGIQRGEAQFTLERGAPVKFELGGQFVKLEDVGQPVRVAIGS
jgi:maltose phosphorylase